MEIKFTIEKEVKWDSIRLKSITTYWIKANDHYLGLTEDEEKAFEMFEIAKQNYRPSTPSHTIKEEIVKI